MGDTVLGSEGKFNKVSTATKAQRKGNKNLMNQASSLINQAYGGLQNQGNLYNNPMYNQGQQSIQNIISQYSPENINKSFDAQIGDPSRQAFQEQTIPNLLESMVAGGAGRSSGAQQQLAQAGSSLEQNLGAQRAQFQQQGMQNQLQSIMQGLNYNQMPINNLMQMAGIGNQGANIGMSQRQFENVYTPGQEGLLMPMLSTGLNVASGGIGGGIAGLAGSMASGGGAGAGFVSGVNKFLGR